MNCIHGLGLNHLILDIVAGGGVVLGSCWFLLAWFKAKVEEFKRSLY